jgi:SAM-dependent methyltransferase
MKQDGDITRRLYTRAGFGKESLLPLRVLHLGCGSQKIPDAVGVDVLQLSGVDVVHDLEKFPWPFAENSFDVIVAHAAFEHLGPTVAVMEEIHRVGAKDARVIICVPYFRSVDAFADPTHKHFFTASSLDYFTDEKNSLASYGYSKKRFRKIGFYYGWPQPSRNPLSRVVKRFITRHPHFYDQYLSVLMPVSILIWELEVIK